MFVFPDCVNLLCFGLFLSDIDSYVEVTPCWDLITFVYADSRAWECLQIESKHIHVYYTALLKAVEWSIHPKRPSQSSAVNFFRIFDRC